MILADKIINERKKNGWSQEELAEQLGVSRQSISKWEGAQAIPDIQKIIKMAELFGVSTDYLLKDEIEPEGFADRTPGVDFGDEVAGYRKVSLEEANEYLELEEKISPRRANMVSLCILGPAFLVLCCALAAVPGFPVGEGPLIAIGVTVLLLMIATAVFFFVIDGLKLSRFQYLENEPIETLYGVSGFVTERKKAAESENVTKIAVGVILCVLSVVPLVATSILGAKDYVITMMVTVLLTAVATGVNLLVRAGSMTGAYNKLLQEGDYSIRAKKRSPFVSKFASAYWLTAVAIYLGWSFYFSSWDRSWIVWPIAGLLFGILMTFLQDKKGDIEE